MTEIAIWVIVVLLGAIVYIVWHGLQATDVLNTGTPWPDCQSLGDTFKLGYEALTMAMQRLEQRVAGRKLEERQ